MCAISMKCSYVLLCAGITACGFLWENVVMKDEWMTNKWAYSQVKRSVMFISLHY